MLLLDAVIFEEHLKRAKESIGVSTDKDFAEVLGINPKTFSRKRNKLDFPTDELLQMSIAKPHLNIDLGYILTGVKSNSFNLGLMNQVKLASDNMPEEAAAKVMKDVIDQTVRHNLNTAKRITDIETMAVFFADMNDDFFEQTRKAVHKCYIEYRKSRDGA